MGVPHVCTYYVVTSLYTVLSGVQCVLVAVATSALLNAHDCYLLPWYMFHSQNFAQSSFSGSSYEILALCTPDRQSEEWWDRTVQASSSQLSSVCYTADAEDLAPAHEWYTTHRAALLAEADKLPYMRLR